MTAFVIDARVPPVLSVLCTGRTTQQTLTNDTGPVRDPVTSPTTAGLDACTSAKPNAVKAEAR
jgi:hypothetical protein